MNGSPIAERQELAVLRRQLIGQCTNDAVVEDERGDPCRRRPRRCRRRAADAAPRDARRASPPRRGRGGAAGARTAPACSASERFRSRAAAQVCCVSCVPTGSCVVWTGSGLSFPVTESLNSRIPVPRERPISGSRLAPKRRRARRSRPTISSGPMLAMGPAYQRFGLRPGGKPRINLGLRRPLGYDGRERERAVRARSGTPF